MGLLALNVYHGDDYALTVVQTQREVEVNQPWSDRMDDPFGRPAASDSNRVNGISAAVG